MLLPHIFVRLAHTNTRTHTLFLPIHPQLNCSRFYECQQHGGCSPFLSLSPRSLLLCPSRSISVLCFQLVLFAVLFPAAKAFFLINVFFLFSFFHSINRKTRPPSHSPLSVSAPNTEPLTLHPSGSALPMQGKLLPVTEGSRDSVLPSSSPDPPLPLLLCLSSSHFLTPG